MNVFVVSAVTGSVQLLASGILHQQNVLNAVSRMSVSNVIFCECCDELGDSHNEASRKLCPCGCGVWV